MTCLVMSFHIWINYTVETYEDGQKKHGERKLRPTSKQRMKMILKGQLGELLNQHQGRTFWQQGQGLMASILGTTV